MPGAASCPSCGSRLPKRSRFCPECGTRVGAGPGETAVQELPPHETGPVPIELSTVEPRFFGVTPPAAVLALAAASLALAVALVSGHVIVGGALLGVAALLAVMFVGVARRLPDAPVSRLSSGVLDAVRAHATFAVETLSAHSSARMELFRLRRELADLRAQQAECARALGEAVYAGDEEGSESARSRMAELDGLFAAKEEEMEQTASGAMERVQRAQLQVQPTQIEPPAPVPEPYPEPSPPPEPVPVPEPTPEPSEPPGPTTVPEPGPVPSPPPQGE
jgi:zinc ribbon protein